MSSRNLRRLNSDIFSLILNGISSLNFFINSSIFGIISFNFSYFCNFLDLITILESILLLILPTDTINFEVYTRRLFSSVILFI